MKHPQEAGPPAGNAEEVEAPGMLQFARLGAG
jgi:hypothetical protein